MSDEPHGEAGTPQPGDPLFQPFFEIHMNIWRGFVGEWNGRITDYNPSGRRFKRKQLNLMAQQEAFDSMGISGSEKAETADALLARAIETAELGKRMR